jgi:hypothetical protein
MAGRRPLGIVRSPTAGRRYRPCHIRPLVSNFIQTPARDRFRLNHGQTLIRKGLTMNETETLHLFAWTFGGLILSIFLLNAVAMQ